MNETSNHHQPQRFPWDAPHQSLKAWRFRPWFRCDWLEISVERKVKWLFRLLRRPVIFGVQRVQTRERTQVWHCFTKIIHLESWRSCCIPRLITVFKGPPPSAVPHSFILSDAGKSTLNTNPLCDTEARASCRQRKSARYRGAPKQRLRRTSIWFRSEMILLVLTKTDVKHLSSWSNLYCKFGHVSPLKTPGVHPCRRLTSRATSCSCCFISCPMSSLGILSKPENFPGFL